VVALLLLLKELLLLPPELQALLPGPSIALFLLLLLL
jgi:hypothetical protein